MNKHGRNRPRPTPHHIISNQYLNSFNKGLTKRKIHYLRDTRTALAITAAAALGKELEKKGNRERGRGKGEMQEALHHLRPGRAVKVSPPETHVNSETVRLAAVRDSARAGTVLGRGREDEEGSRIGNAEKK